MTKSRHGRRSLITSIASPPDSGGWWIAITAGSPGLSSSAPHGQRHFGSGPFARANSSIVAITLAIAASR
jgi:hypothetical protein